VVARGIRERIAIGFLAAAIVLAAVLGVMTVRSFTQPSSGAVAAQGDVAGDQAASGGRTSTSSGGGGSTSTNGGGGSAVAAGGKIKIGGFDAVYQEVTGTFLKKKFPMDKDGTASTVDWEKWLGKVHKRGPFDPRHYFRWRKFYPSAVL